MSVKYEASLNVVVEVTCEACEKVYTYEHRISSTSRLEGNATRGVLQQFRAKEFGAQACPECGYIQSWMIEHWQTMRQGFVGFGLGILAIAGTAPCIGWPASKDWHHVALLALYAAIGLVVTVTAFFVSARFFIPNKKFQGMVFTPREPKVNY